ncbi:MAG: cytochrome C [Sulfurimonas sp.]|uniref:c-type cytochrome n=1 Tax=Sulfurimonas sp. TaxID=2022749 RepID=UPI0025E08DBB|nr:c-type cytochrome [Sulfurimonas sp.]MCK9491714.1 cytochrome C [Sulfurimonas sp.]
MKKSIVLVAILGLGSFAMADVYQKCVICHGKDGEKAALVNKSKVIKDMTKAEIVASMKGYQDGTYGGAMKGMMVEHSKNLSEADINEIAEKIGK